MQRVDGAGSEEQAPRCQVGRPRRGTALQRPQRRPGRGKRPASPEAAAPAPGPSSSAGRGRGRKRQRQQAPPPPPQPEEDEQAHDGCSSGGAPIEGEGSDGDTDSEASALAAAAQAEAHATPVSAGAPAPAETQLSVREQARQLLMRMGIPADRAEMALDEAEEQAEGEGLKEDPLAWAEQAQFVLACRVEFEEERDQLAAAMDVSLQEEQQRKQAQLPLHERPDEEIWQEFADSALLRMLAVCASLSSLLAPPLRQPLLDYLQLEKRCKKWYYIASHYFRAQAEQLVSLLGEAPAAAAAACTDNHAAADACVASPSAAAPAAADAAPAAALAAAGTSGRPAGLPPDINEDLAAVLAAELSELQQRVQAAVYSMPAGSDSTAVPQLFLAAVPEGQQPEVVEVLSDSDAERGGTHQRDQQQGQQQQQQQRQRQRQECAGQQGSKQKQQQQLSAG